MGVSLEFTSCPPKLNTRRVSSNVIYIVSKRFMWFYIEVMCCLRLNVTKQVRAALKHVRSPGISDVNLLRGCALFIPPLTHSLISRLLLLARYAPSSLNGKDILREVLIIFLSLLCRSSECLIRWCGVNSWSIKYFGAITVNNKEMVGTWKKVPVFSSGKNSI